MRVEQIGDATLYLGDALEVMPELESKSIDAIITDLPYGRTSCSWDVVIPFAPMWVAVKYVLKPRGVFVTTASQPFTSLLVMSNLAWFKQELVWDKVRVTNILNANRMMLIRHENILIFSDGVNRFNPQKSGKGAHPFGKVTRSASVTAGNITETDYAVGYPQSILRYMRPNNLTEGYLHPTQKSIALYEYLMRTYTNEGDTVLDFCMGSGTTGCAAARTGRHFVGVELREDYFDISVKRITAAQAQLRLPLKEA